MRVDIYNYFKHSPKYNKLIGDDYLFVEYKCPIIDEEFELWTESRLITYVINQTIKRGTPITITTKTHAISPSKISKSIYS
jgi:hypothetical protein